MERKLQNKTKQIAQCKEKLTKQTNEQQNGKKTKQKTNNLKKNTNRTANCMKEKTEIALTDPTVYIYPTTPGSVGLTVACMPPKIESCYVHTAQWKSRSLPSRVTKQTQIATRSGVRWRGRCDRVLVLASLEASLFSLRLSQQVGHRESAQRDH